MGRTRRLGSALACAAALLSAAVLAGCAAPQFTYVADSSASTFFKVPYGWHKIADDSLASQFKASTGGSGLAGAWKTGYDAAPAPSASHLFSPAVNEPFVLGMVFPLTPTASNAMSYNGLRDLILPVTAAGRQAAAGRGFPLTGFRLLRDQVLTPGGGVHGVRVTFDYTYPGGVSDTFDQVALTDADSTQVYVLLVHCLATCYRQHRKEIDAVMTSFTVKKP